MSVVQRAPEPMSPPTVVLETKPRYLFGLPMMVSMTVRNDTTDMLFWRLPFVEWFGNPLDARWVVRTEAGTTLEAGIADTLPADDTGGGFALDPTDACTMLVDLAALLPRVPAGTHALSAEFPVDVPVVSEPVALRVDLPSSFDAQIVEAVREGTSGDGTWGTFFDRDWTWSEVPGLTQASDPVRADLALPLFVHRALYGDENVADLELGRLDAFAQGLLEAEAAVLRHEILHAGGRPVAEQWKEYIATRWPGLRWRVEQTERGFGFLRVTRDRVQARLAYRPMGEIDSLLRP